MTKLMGPTKTGPRRATTEQRISILQERSRKLDDRIAKLMAQRADVEELLAHEYALRALLALD
jgi:hypothetical protein